MQFSLPCVLFVIIDILYDFFIRQSAKRLLTTGHKTSVETFQLERAKNNGQFSTEIRDSPTCRVWCISYFKTDHVLYRNSLFPG